MRSVAGLITLAACLASCASAQQPSGCTTWPVGRAADRDWVEAVLEDVLARQYCADLDERRNAFDYLEANGMGDLRDRVVEVAHLEVSRFPEAAESLDAIAVRESLLLLVGENDPSARDLIAARISDRHPWVQAAAFRGGTSLSAWELTDTVVELLETTPKTKDNLFVVVAAVRFLAASSLSSPSVCAHIESITRAYADCVVSEGQLGCRQLLESIRGLDSRFQCKAPPRPGGDR